MILFFKKLLSILFVLLGLNGNIQAQKNLISSDSSGLTGIKFPKGTLLDKRGFFVGVAKTTLEMESGIESVSDMEVFVWQNKSGKKVDSEAWLIAIIQRLDSVGWKLQTSERDHSYMYLSKQNQKRLMYISPGKKEANLYFGKLVDDQPAIPPGKNDMLVAAENTSGENKPAMHINSTLVGSWGNLTGAKINYYDDATGNMIGAGLSKGSGYEFNADGSYAQSFLATSSHPTYKIFVYITGGYAVSGNQVTLTATDRHYRKWEYEQLVTDEHSKPATETHQWVIRPNQYAGKPCLYLLIKGGQPEREFCHD